ncbi:MAG: peptide chain release factor N(5)-glutamine methyltransferase [Sphingomonadaceae bacterium]
MNATDALRDAALRLAAVSDTPRLDAELLMAHAAGMERGDLILGLRDMEAPEGFTALVERRLAHEPVSHIIGTRDFWTLTLNVTPHVLTPRPDSETLIEAAVAHFAGTTGPRRILDLGTGSGALLLAALSEWPAATGLGIDISAAALDVARCNAERCDLSDRAELRIGNWFEGIDECFDLILANPPYIATDAMLPRDVAEYEPHLALFAGADGLDAYRILAPALSAHLALGGMAAVEIGFDQGETAAVLFAEQGFSVSVLNDLGGNPRCLKLPQA